MSGLMISKDAVQKAGASQKSDMACVQGCQWPAGGGHWVGKEDASCLSIGR